MENCCTALARNICFCRCTLYSLYNFINNNNVSPCNYEFWSPNWPTRCVLYVFGRCAQTAVQGHSGWQRACPPRMDHPSCGGTPGPGTGTRRPPFPDTAPSPPSRPSWWSESSIWQGTLDVKCRHVWMLCFFNNWVYLDDGSASLESHSFLKDNSCE